MTIRPGEEWGTSVDRPDDLVVLPGDAALADAVAAGRAPLAVAGGDLHRAVGNPEPRPQMQRVDVDLIRAVVDGEELVAVAHVVARRSWWRGPIVAVMNVDHIGAWNVAPRAHPNDGRLDIVEVDRSMGVRQRWQARRRLPQGTHVPHPAISTRRATDATWAFDPPLRLWLDGVARGPVSELSVTVEPDAYALHI